MEKQEMVKALLVLVGIIIFFGGWFLINLFKGKNKNNQQSQASQTQQNTGQQTVDFEQIEFARRSKRNQKTFWSIVLVVYSLLFTLSVMYGEVFKIGEYPVPAWLIVFIILSVYTAMSFTTQGADKVGAKILFGGLLYETSPGLIFIPFGFCTHESESMGVIQKELPTDVPSLYGKEEDGVTQVKYIRMTTNYPAVQQGGNTQDSQDPLQTGRLTLNTLITISFRVSSKPGAFFQYFSKIGKVERLLGIADDIAVGFVKKEVKEKSPSDVLKEWERIEDDATDKLKEVVESYGVEDVKITVKEFGVPKDVNKSMAERTAAKVSVETKRFQGEAEKEMKLQQAVGIQAMKKAELEGPFEALKEAIQNLGFTKEQALFLANQEAVAKMYEKAKYSIVPSGKGGFMDQAAFMAVMQEAIQASSIHQQGGLNNTNSQRTT